MQSLVIILLKINLALLLFAAAYYFILRRLTFYSINRSFLLFGILFSSVYPFIDLTELFYQQKKIPVTVTEWIPTINKQVTEGVQWKWMIIAFCVGALIMLIRLIRQFISLYLLHKRSENSLINNTPVRIVNEQLSPFSFWKNIYINPALHKTDELEHIIAHENIHVGQLHTADIILAELSVVFYWFNPGVWLMKKAIKENLEFITDEKVLKTGTDRKSYQYSLLDVGQLKPATTIANSFNLSDLKKRIRMMNARRSSKLTLGRYVFILPVLIFISLAFTIAKKDIIKEVIAAKEASIEVNPSSIISVPDANTEKIAVTPPARPRTRTNQRQENITLPNIDRESIRSQLHGTQIPDSIAKATGLPSTIRRVQGFPLSDTTTGLRRVSIDAIPKDSVITVVGRPSRRLITEPQQESTAKDSSGNQQHNTERVVIGYRTSQPNN
jgi:hypothetical protein